MWHAGHMFEIPGLNTWTSAGLPDAEETLVQVVETTAFSISNKYS